jgi:uncharacterized protein YhaN
MCPKGDAPVKTFAFFVVALVVAIVALGFWRGWFEFGSQKADGKVHTTLDINVDKLKAEKDHFKKLLGDKSKSLKAELAQLKNKAKDLTGEAKAKLEKEIDALTKRHEHIEKKMNEVEGSSEEKFQELKNSLKDETEPGTGEKKE